LNVACYFFASVIMGDVHVVTQDIIMPLANIPKKIILQKGRCLSVILMLLSSCDAAWCVEWQREREG